MVVHRDVVPDLAAVLRQCGLLVCDSATLLQLLSSSSVVGLQPAISSLGPAPQQQQGAGDLLLPHLLTFTLALALTCPALTLASHLHTPSHGWVQPGNHGHVGLAFILCYSIFTILVHFGTH